MYKIFIGLEKSRAEKKNIKLLKKEDGTILENNQDIMTEEQLFYKELYSSKVEQHIARKEEITDYLADMTHLTLNEEEQQELGEDITEEEIWEAINQSQDNKSPGNDGFTIEFYKFFWPEIKDLLLNSYLYSYEHGSLSIAQKQAVISLIPKSGKDLTNIKNWRPISLLNTDYKILTKILANRIKKYLPKLINTDQTGFVPGRYIGTNIHKIVNISEYCQKYNIEATQINIDFEKAFDTIEWDYILESLDLFKFPKQIIKWVKILYTDISTSILNNGNLSESFKPTRGVRQGCPASPYVFVLAAETLALNSLTCICSGKSATSSKNKVPPSAA